MRPVCSGEGFFWERNGIAEKSPSWAPAFLCCEAIIYFPSDFLQKKAYWIFIDKWQPAPSFSVESPY